MSIISHTNFDEDMDKMDSKSFVVTVKMMLPSNMRRRIVTLTVTIIKLTASDKSFCIQITMCFFPFSIKERFYQCYEILDSFFPTLNYFSAL